MLSSFPVERTPKITISGKTLQNRWTQTLVRGFFHFKLKLGSTNFEGLLRNFKSLWMASYIFKYGKRTPSTHLEAWWHGHLWNHKQILPINTQKLFFMITQFTSNQFTRPTNSLQMSFWVVFLKSSLTAKSVVFQIWKLNILCKRLAQWRPSQQNCMKVLQQMPQSSDSLFSPNDWFPLGLPCRKHFPKVSFGWSSALAGLTIINSSEQTIFPSYFLKFSKIGASTSLADYLLEFSSSKSEDIFHSILRDEKSFWEG